jgi:hypothetical protein
VLWLQMMHATMQTCAPCQVRQILSGYKKHADLDIIHCH